LSSAPAAPSPVNMPPAGAFAPGDGKLAEARLKLERRKNAVAENDLLTNLGWDSVRGALAQCSVQAQEFESYLLAQLESLEQRFQKLSERERSLHDEAQCSVAQSQAEQAATAEEVQRLREELARSKDQIERLERTAAKGNAAESEVGILRQELEKAAAQSARMAGMAVELADARAELAELKSRQNMGQTQVVADLERRLRDVEQDRAALENELDHIRKRAAEANTALAEHKRREAEERAEWSGELKQLRRALEKQSMLLVEQQETGYASSTRKTVPVRGESTPTISDPVVDSVMEQFESLQKDMIKRRQQKNVKNGHQGVAP
jgi:chromosome segregation ATPase